MSISKCNTDSLKASLNQHILVGDSISSILTHPPTPPFPPKGQISVPPLTTRSPTGDSIIPDKCFDGWMDGMIEEMMDGRRSGEIRDGSEREHASDVTKKWWAVSAFYSGAGGELKSRQ